MYTTITVKVQDCDNWDRDAVEKSVAIDFTGITYSKYAAADAAAAVIKELVIQLHEERQAALEQAAADSDAVAAKD